MKKLIHILCSISLICSLWACSSKEQAYSKDAFFFDTYITITIYNEDNAEELLSNCIQKCAELENVFSRTKKTSELYKVNHRTTSSIEVSDALATVIKSGLDAYKISKQHFDISVAPLLEVWDFKNENPTVPSDATIQSTLAMVGSDKIKLENNTLTFLDPNIQIDVGALAKGYIADGLKEYLVKEGVKCGIINLGGNVLCIGKKTDDSLWKVGIQKPFAKSGETIYVAEANDISIVSSGIYERHFKIDDTIYHHLLDAKTGYPMNNGLWQVSILTPSSLEADKLSSSVFLMGLEKGLNYIESLEECEAIFVDDKGKIHLTSGLKE